MTQDPEQPEEATESPPEDVEPGGHVEADAPDTTTVEDMVEEGAPLEPDDLTEVDSVPSLKEQLAALQVQLDERTADLQRAQAEFVNFKRRVERDREMLKQNAKFEALTPIVEVLDNIDRAREHGPLEGGFKSVAEQLEGSVAGQGLVRFGEPGDAFDPSLHDALGQAGEDPEVSVTTCAVIAKAGYKIGDRVVRAAQVLVSEPAAGSPEGQDAAPGE